MLEFILLNEVRMRRFFGYRISEDHLIRHIFVENKDNPYLNRFLLKNMQDFFQDYEPVPDQTASHPFKMANLLPAMCENMNKVG